MYHPTDFLVMFAGPDPECDKKCANGGWCNKDKICQCQEGKEIDQLGWTRAHMLKSYLVWATETASASSTKYRPKWVPNATSWLVKAKFQTISNLYYCCLNAPRSVEQWIMET